MDDDIWLDEDDEQPVPRKPRPRTSSWDSPKSVPSKKKSSAPLIAVIVIGCVFSLSAIGIIAYVMFDRLGGVSVAGSRSRETLNAESNRIFSEFDSQQPLASLPAGEHPVRDEILELLDRLEEFSESPDPSRVSELVDLKRLAKRIELTGGLSDWSYFDKAQLRTQLVEFAVEDIQLGTMTLAGFVKASDDPQTRIAYVFADYPQTTEVGEFRLWVAQGKDGHWKLYDWERLDLGVAESVEIGIYCRYAESIRLDSFYTLNDYLLQADALIAEGDYPAAARQLELAENTAVVAEFSDYCHVLTAYRWQQLSEYPKARVCFEKVLNPEQTPGAFYGLLNCTEYDDPEFALRNATLYENCVGPGIDLCSRKAQLLEELKRPDEARLEWQKVLRIEADNPNALTALLKGFSDEKKSDLTPYLERLDDPVLTAISLVNYADAEDRTSRDFLLDFVRTQEPDSARTEGMIAQTFYIDGRFEQAAEHYEAAFKKESDTEAREQYVTPYLDLMAELGRVLEAVDRVPDKEEAFDYLVVGYEEDEITLSDDEYQEIARRYYKEFPDNGWAVYYRADALNEADAAVEAVDLLQKFLKTADRSSDPEDEYLDSSLRSLLASVQLASGQNVTTLLEKDHSNFTDLANAALADERWDSVKELIAVHDSKQPESLDLLRIQGRLAAHEKRWGDAIAFGSAADALVKADPDNSYMSWEFKQLVRRAYQNTGQWKRYYDGEAEKQQAFGTLGRDLISRRDWSTFRKLVETHQQIVPDDPQIPLMKSEVEWFYEDYAACAKSCKAALKLAETDTEDMLGEWQKSRLRNRQLACLLHLKRHTEARKLAQQSLDDEQDSTRLAIVAAARKDVNETRRLATQAFEQTESLQTLYEHPQVGPFVLQQHFTDLHEKCPVTIPYPRARDKAVFLFDKTPSLDEKTITDLIRKLAPDEQVIVEEYQPNHARATSAFAVRLSSTVFQIVSINGKDDDWEPVHPDPRISQTLAKNTDWLVIHRGRWDNDEDHDTQVARKLGLQLATNAAAAIISSQWSWRLVDPDSPSLQDWARTGYLQPGDFPEVNAKSEHADRVQPVREFEAALREVVMSKDGSTPKSLKIQIQIGDFQMGEPLWVDVQNARHSSYGHCEFDGILKSTSKLQPTFRAGLKVRINQWLVRAWQQADGPIHYHPLHSKYDSSVE